MTIGKTPQKEWSQIIFRPHTCESIGLILRPFATHFPHHVDVRRLDACSQRNREVQPHQKALAVTSVQEQNLPQGVSHSVIFPRDQPMTFPTRRVLKC